MRFGFSLRSEIFLGRIVWQQLKKQHARSGETWIHAQKPCVGPWGRGLGLRCFSCKAVLANNQFTPALKYNIFKVSCYRMSRCYVILSLLSFGPCPTKHTLPPQASGSRVKRLARSAIDEVGHRLS